MTQNGYKELTQLRDEYIEDVTVNVMNIGEKSMLTSTIKASWCGRLYAYRHNLKTEEKNLEVLRATERKIIQSGLKVVTSEAELKQLKLSNSNAIIAKEERIDDLKEIISFLRETQKLVAFFGNDIKNAVDYMKLDA